MKYSLVTGAASDVGKAICLELANNGKYVLMLDIDNASMEDFINTLPNNCYHRHLAVDFTKTEETNKLITDFIVSNNIEIEDAVFAAGIFSVKPLRMIKHDSFIKSLDIAIFSVIQIMQIVTAKKINGNNFKNAVIISSVSAIQGVKGYGLYSTVKAGLLGLMRSLAVELAPMRINAIVPGGIRTKATSFIYDRYDNLNPRCLLEEGTPVDFAKLVKFLLSDDSKWITGQEFVIDGGSSIN